MDIVDKLIELGKIAGGAGIVMWGLTKIIPMIVEARRPVIANGRSEQVVRSLDRIMEAVEEQGNRHTTVLLEIRDIHRDNQRKAEALREGQILHMERQATMIQDLKTIKEEIFKIREEE